MDMNRLAQLLDFVQASPKPEPFLLFALAKEYEKLAQFEEAEAYYQKLFEERPDYLGLYYHFAKFLEARNRWAEALIFYDRGIVLAQKQGERQTLGELQTAKMLLQDQMEDQA